MDLKFPVNTKQVMFFYREIFPLEELRVQVVHCPLLARHMSPSPRHRPHPSHRHMLEKTPGLLGDLLKARRLLLNVSPPQIKQPPLEEAFHRQRWQELRCQTLDTWHPNWLDSTAYDSRLSPQWLELHRCHALSKHPPPLL